MFLQKLSCEGNEWVRAVIIGAKEQKRLLLGHKNNVSMVKYVHRGVSRQGEKALLETGS